MKKIYGNEKDWTKANWKKSFENLANDGYSFEKIRRESWFREDAWVTTVLNWAYAQKVVKETEKAIQFNVVNQYGSSYDIWFPKKALISY